MMLGPKEKNGQADSSTSPAHRLFYFVKNAHKYTILQAWTKN